MMGMVRRYFPAQELAEEILNNGFLRAFQKIESYGFKGSFEGWLRKIIFHAISDYAKSQVKYSDHILLVEKDEFVHKDAASDLYYDDLMKLVYDLPETARIVFNMYVFESKSHKEIAQSIGISEGTSKWYLAEARKMLKQKIEKLELHLKRYYNVREKEFIKIDDLFKGRPDREEAVPPGAWNKMQALL